MGKKKEAKMGRKKSLTSIICISLVLVLASMLLLVTQGATQPKTLKIGYLLCLTGWYSVFDAVEEKDVKIVAQMINDRGGLTIQGQKYNIELVGEDGKSSLDGITAGANRLAYDHKVKFVVGPTGFFSTGSSPVFEPNKILHVSGYVSNQPGEIDASTPFGFLAFNASIGTSISVIKAMKKEFPNVKKVAIVTPDDGAVPYLIPKVKKILESYGYTAVGDTVPFPNEMEDFSPIAAKLNAIKDADAIFMENGAPIHAGNKKPYVYQGLSPCSDIIAIAGAEASNNVLTSGLTPNAPGNPALLDEVYKRGAPNRNFYLFNPNGLWVLTRMIQAANSLDPDVVKAKWESMDKVETLFGTGYVSGDQTYGIKKHAIGHPLPYQKVVNGKVVFGGWIDVGPIP
jgi:hypothetical protein